MHKQKTLDPVLLGRPLQALEVLAAELARQVTLQLQQTGHRNITLHVEEGHFAPAHPAAGTLCSCLDVALARSTVQSIMDARYGFVSEVADTPSPGVQAQQSATEKRIASNLQAAIERAVSQVLPSTARGDMAPAPGSTVQHWQWNASIRVGELPPQPLSVRLTTALSQRLEAQMQSQRRIAPGQTVQAAALLVDLQAILAEKTITAADVQQLRVGSILPLTLERAHVHLNGQAMLSASVAEHQGTLHLTAFETLE